MRLDDICRAYWQKGSTGGCPDAGCRMPLADMIRAYQNHALKEADRRMLLTRVICGNGRARRVYGKVLRAIRQEIDGFYYNRFDMAVSATEQWAGCLTAVISRRAEKCLEHFDSERLSGTDDGNVMPLISAYLNSALHVSAVKREVGLENFCSRMAAEVPEIDWDQFLSDAPDAEQVAVLEDLFQKIVIAGRGFEKARESMALESYVNEILTDQNPRSVPARQQKSRLKKYFMRKWMGELDEIGCRYLMERLEIWIAGRPPELEKAT